ncbi:MAG TPA: ABC transporter permease subunit, partial [Ktedonobacteraceae bacterium]|jgi:ABC-type transport system involved in multi-copper enzyme maturation permease subunit
MIGKTQLIPFQALLTKEMRVCLRRERTIWVLIIYILLMGLLGWFSLNTNSNYNNPGSKGLSSVGLSLYQLLTTVQILLITFILPSFTATAVNGEKERQTFDMLICSCLSAFSLVTSKLIAGLINALLLIGASVPFFSLVLFFGGVSLSQVMNSLAVLIVTTLFIGTLGLFCSTVFQRPAVSTAIAYTSSLFWALLPSTLFFVILSSENVSLFATHPSHSRLLLLWNPIVALSSTYPASSGIEWIYFMLGLGSYSNNGANAAIYAPYTIGNINVAPWLAYSIISILMTVVLFFLSILAIKPHTLSRLRRQVKKQAPSESLETEV